MIPDVSTPPVLHCPRALNEKPGQGDKPGLSQRCVLAAASEVTLEDFEESRQPRLPTRIQPTTELGVPNTAAYADVFGKLGLIELLVSSASPSRVGYRC